jgi:purine nucleosidase/pyrimidine-specific ribonucleoside hydrolase
LKQSRPILIDTDTGVDDALALILALRSPEVAVKAITTVAGNVEVGKCTTNVLFLLRLLHYQHDIIVARGADRPLRRALVTAPEVHGRDGLGNLNRRSGSTRSVPLRAEQTIIELCQEFGKQLTVVAIGPLTNIALAWRRNPSALRRMGSLVSMGGAFCVPGNTGPVAEFNYYVDPDAANIVLHSGLPITVIPLDLTEQFVLMHREFEHQSKRGRRRVVQSMSRFTECYMRYHEQTQGFYGGYVHDPLAVAAAINPRLFQTIGMKVSVETRGRWMRGMTVGTVQRDTHSRPGVVKVAVAVHKNRFLTLLRKRLWK